MKDVMVTVRMPKALANELKELAKKNHFMDLSEEIRSIARQKWLSHTNPLFEIKKVSEDIKEEVKEKTQRKIQEEVAKELDKIKANLKKEGLLNE